MYASATSLWAYSSCPFSLSQSNHLTVTLDVSLCHPGYRYNNDTQRCECQQPADYFTITCNKDTRYFVVQVSMGN